MSVQPQRAVAMRHRMNGLGMGGAIELDLGIGRSIGLWRADGRGKSVGFGCWEGGIVCKGEIRSSVRLRIRRE
jgi:hypothetical protein